MIVKSVRISAQEMSGSTVKNVCCIFYITFMECVQTLDIHFVYVTATCLDGDVRLVDGDTEYSGLVEVCFSQRWGTVNGDGWSSADTQVVCKQLGYQTAGD